MSDMFEKVQDLSWDEWREAVHRENLALAYQFCGTWPKATQDRVAHAIVQALGRRAAQPTEPTRGDHATPRKDGNATGGGNDDDVAQADTDHAAPR